MEQLKMMEKMNYSRQQAVDETRIRRQIENQVKALCRMDTEKVMSIYAPGRDVFRCRRNIPGCGGEKESLGKRLFYGRAAPEL